MIKTVCVSNQKGGCGKTTSTFNLAAALALKGEKILMVDADGQANLTSACGFNPDEIEEQSSSLFHLITGKKVKTADFVMETKIENLTIIPSCAQVSMLEQELNRMTKREYRFDKALRQIREQYDYIFIDTPPNLGHITFNSFVASNAIIVVYTATTFALDGISQLVKSIYKIQDEDEDIDINGTRIIGCLWNDYDSRTLKINRKMKHKLASVKVLEQHFPEIPAATVIVQAQEANQPVMVFAPRHKASLQYNKFADEFLKLSKETNFK